MKFSNIPLLPSAIGVFLLLAGGPGTRLGLWEFRFGFSMMRWAVYLGLASAGLALLFLIIPGTRRGQAVWLLSALVIGLVVSYVPWSNLRQARSVPPIHDITTDTQNPPHFVAILPLRAGAPNPHGYDGEEVARQQKEAYPDIEPYRMNASAEDAYKKALTAAKEMGWEIITTAPEAGRIEATATTLWYGFKDDVVVRISEDNGGSVIDVRSKSRVGKSDVGANAARSRAHLKVLQGQ